jgi:uncharacterized membrane protein
MKLVLSLLFIGVGLLYYYTPIETGLLFNPLYMRDEDSSYLQWGLFTSALTSLILIMCLLRIAYNTAQKD